MKNITNYKASWEAWKKLLEFSEPIINEDFIHKDSIVKTQLSDSLSGIPSDLDFKVEDYMLFKGGHLYLLSLKCNSVFQIIVDETFIKK